MAMTRDEQLGVFITKLMKSYKDGDILESADREIKLLAYIMFVTEKIGDGTLEYHIDDGEGYFIKRGTGDRVKPKLH